MSDGIVGTVIHEAGHAAVALYYGVEFDYVTCRPEYEDNTLGHLAYKSDAMYFNEEFYKAIWPPGSMEPKFKMYPDERKYNYTSCRISLAGAAAELAMFGYYSEYGCRRDFENARLIIKYKGLSPKSPNQVDVEFERLFELTKKMFNDQGLIKPLWPKTWELSKAMYYNDRTLTYKEAKAVYDAN